MMARYNRIANERLLEKCGLREEGGGLVTTALDTVLLEDFGPLRAAEDERIEEFFAPMRRFRAVDSLYEQQRLVVC
jgi:hypothetical protein